MVRHQLRLDGIPRHRRRCPRRSEPAFPGQAWRLRDPTDAAPGVSRFIDQIALFLTLVGLTSLLVGGIGVANGVRAWLDARARTIATLRCLGATSRLVFAVCLIQVMALAVGGILVGVVSAPRCRGWAASSWPASCRCRRVPGIYPLPLVLAAAYGLLIALCFALWPLGRAARIPGGALFRDALIPEKTRPSALLIVGKPAAGRGAGRADDRRRDRPALRPVFLRRRRATLVLFRAAASLVMRLARRAPAPALARGAAGHRQPAPARRADAADAAVRRPRPVHAGRRGADPGQYAAPDPGAVAGQRAELLLHRHPERPDGALRALVQAQPGVHELKQVPSLRARIVAVKGVPVQDQVVTTPETAWALRGDRGLTYAATPPEGHASARANGGRRTIDGPPLVSFDAAMAKGWHVGIGDVIRVNVLGRDIDLKIANLRDIQWQSLGINFFMVASPGLLSQRAAYPYRDRPGRRRRAGRAAAGGHRRDAQRHRHPGGGRAVVRSRRCWAGSARR